MLKIVYAALEVLCNAIPSGLGAIVWIGFKIGPELIPAMVLALLCGLAITNFCGALSQRPLVFVGRFFEISLLAGFIDSFAPKLGAWGLADTPDVRLTMVIAACVGAALLQPVFYSLRLQRLTRFVPATVFAGFLNAVALLLLISQIKQIHMLAIQQPDLLWPALIIGAVCLGVAVVLKQYKPHLPAAVLGLLAASLTALLLEHSGYSAPDMMPSALSWGLPIGHIDWALFKLSGPTLRSLLTDLALISFLLGLVVFLNTIVAAETLSQFDDKPAATRAQNLQLSVGQIISACLGSIPMSGAPSASMAALRAGGLERAMLPLLAVLCLVIYPLAVLAWLPQAAMIGLLLFDAYCLMDRASLAELWRYAAKPSERRAMSLLRQEDLLTVVLVTLAGTFINMVAALLLGMVLGLILFAKRNGKSPIKDVHDGRAWRSNCMYSAADTQVLALHGARIQCVRLQGALYFGVASSLRVELEALLPSSPQPQWLVLDWRAVVSQDTTLARMFEQFEQATAKRRVRVLHCARAGDASAYADLDRALEFCETELLAAEPHDGHTGHTQHMPQAVTLQVNALLHGLSDSAQQRVRDCFESRHYAVGERMLVKGETSRDLHLIAQGRADVMIHGGAIRLAGVSSGAILGEMGFLDGTPRAADVVAAEPLVSHILSRDRFDALSLSHPDIAQQILQNLCAELAGRLRALHVLISRDRS